jgi:hypothetical protein
VGGTSRFLSSYPLLLPVKEAMSETDPISLCRTTRSLKTRKPTKLSPLAVFPPFFLSPTFAFLPSPSRRTLPTLPTLFFALSLTLVLYTRTRPLLPLFPGSALTPNTLSTHPSLSTPLLSCMQSSFCTLFLFFLRGLSFFLLFSPVSPIDRRDNQILQHVTAYQPSTPPPLPP